jgi:rifampicin phosphotransferase
MTGPVFTLPLADRGAVLEVAGGKGAWLARLAAAGLPVPEGFHLTVAAYRLFVAANGLQPVIESALAGAGATGLAGVEAASQAIRARFLAGRVPAEVAEAISRGYAGLGGGPVAVRSSATLEDLPGASFAGQQDSFLNVTGADAVLAAVRGCWASLWNARAIGYRLGGRLDQRGAAVAVVVQRLVPAEGAGVLFTADPASGRRDRIVVNAAWGLGEAVAGGLVTADVLVADAVTGRVVTRQIADKQVMTVPAGGGTAQVPVPRSRRRAPVLDDRAVIELVRLGRRIEALHGGPVDVEWALAGGRLYVVQARPVTAIAGGGDAAGEWNDSLSGDYLWSNANVGEAVPDVMTPCTWSLIRLWVADAIPFARLPCGPHPGLGNIGGRFYMNLSLAASAAAAFGIAPRRFAAMTEQFYGRIPGGLQIPLVRLPRGRLLAAAAAIAARAGLSALTRRRRLRRFLPGAPARMRALRAQIATAATAAELAGLWQAQVAPLLHEAATVGAGAGALSRPRRKLRALAGDQDADILLTAEDGRARLASLGPLVGLTEFATGATGQAAFLHRYGHRGPHELEVSIPRPAEDPGWAGAQLADLRRAAADASALLARQEKLRAQAWDRLRRRDPGKEAAARRLAGRWAAAAREREAVRSEVARVFWVMRSFVQRAGALTGHGDDLFFLPVQEILAVLAGDRAPLAHIAERKAAYRRYQALPPYPALIRGRFDPLAWAADPHRRGDLFDASTVNPAPASQAVSGQPGSPGVAQGRAQVVATIAEAAQLEPGDILVTPVTNIGWTPLFPRLAAIVTDVGAPLSHAAIIARELGIPAVIGCGNATTLLHTGDILRVDGGRGTVQIVGKA